MLRREPRRPIAFTKLGYAIDVDTRAVDRGIKLVAIIEPAGVAASFAAPRESLAQQIDATLYVALNIGFAFPISAVTIKAVRVVAADLDVLMLFSIAAKRDAQFAVGPAAVRLYVREVLVGPVPMPYPGIFTIPLFEAKLFPIFWIELLIAQQ